MDLKDFFEKNKKVALGFSGGTDSAYLLWAGLNCGADIKPYYVRSAFQPEFEFKDAMAVCGLCGVSPEIITIDVLNCEDISSNGPLRCYYCKKRIFGEIINHAAKDGYSTVIDGTNATDDYNDRPGMKAVKELGVLSPLRQCGISKAQVREYSENAGLFTWNKPSYSCLATRVAANELITAEKLEKIEKGEMILFDEGFSDFRLRYSGQTAVIQVKADQYELARILFPQIKSKLLSLFCEVILDNNCR